MAIEVFISYSTPNIRTAEMLSKELNMLGISNWLAPNQLIYGPEYAGQITDAIRNAKILLVLISKASLNSDQVLNEIALATDYKKYIVAYRLDNTPLPDKFKYYLVAKHWIDASTDNITAITRLTNLIREIRNESSDKPKSREVLEVERAGNEIHFMFVRTLAAILTVLIWIILQFILFNYAYGTHFYIISILAITLAAIFIIIKIIGPIFDNSGKYAKTILKEIIKAFKGE